jgi:hypothetical protein
VSKILDLRQSDAAQRAPQIRPDERHPILLFRAESHTREDLTLALNCVESWRCAKAS